MKKFLRKSVVKPWKLRRLRAFAGGAVLALSALPVPAADITWDVSAPGNFAWGTSSNWTPAAVPGSGDTAHFGSAITSLQNVVVGTQNIAAIAFENTIGIQLRNGTLTFDANGAIDSHVTSANIFQPTVGFVLTDGLTASNTGGILGLQGVISGTGDLVLNALGSGSTLQVLNANTYSGNTFLHSGSGSGIAIQGDTPFSTGTVFTSTLGATVSSLSSQLANTFVLEGDLDYYQLLAGGLSGSLSGAGQLTKLGAGALTLSGSNSYSGGTVVNSGTLVAAGVQAFGTDRVVIDGATSFGRVESQVNNLFTLRNGGTLEVAGTVFRSLVDADPVLVSSDAGPANLRVEATGVLASFDATTGGSTLIAWDQGGSMENDGQLQMESNGAGARSQTVAVLDAQSTVVNRGRIDAVTVSSSAGASTTGFVLSDAVPTLRFSLDNSGDIDLQAVGRGENLATGIVAGNAADLTNSGTVTIRSDGGIGSTDTRGGLMVTTAGEGSVTNTNTGAIFMESFAVSGTATGFLVDSAGPGLGLLEVDNAGRLGVSVDVGGTGAADAFLVGHSPVPELGTPGRVNFVNQASGGIEVFASASGAGRSEAMLLEVSGTGASRLENAGLIEVSASSTLGGASATVASFYDNAIGTVVNSGTISAASTGVNSSVDRAIQFFGPSGTMSNSGLVQTETTSGGPIVANGVNFFGGSGFLANTGTLSVKTVSTGGDDGVVASAVANFDNGFVLQNEGLILVDIGATTGGVSGFVVQSFGTTTLTNSGTIEMRSASGGSVRAISASASTTFTNSGQITGNVVFSAGTHNITLISGGQINGTLQVNPGVTSRLTLTGTGSQLYSAAVTGTTTFNGQLVKDGAGTWSLDRDLTSVTGNTVDLGTLLVNAVLSGTMTVEEPGTLGGGGTVLGDTVLAGTLAPGNSTGTLAFGGALFLESTAQIEMELAALLDFDRAVAGGLLTYDGTLNIVLLGGYIPEVGNSFDLFDAGSMAPGSTFDTIVFNVAGVEADFDYTSGILTITAVPEPSAVLMALGGAFLLLRRRRITR